VRAGLLKTIKQQLIYGDFDGKRFRLLLWMLPFRGLSVTFVHCAQTAEDIDTFSLAYDSPMSLPDCYKILLTSFDPFLLKFCSKLTHPAVPVDLSVGDIWSQISPNGYRQRNGHNGEPIGNHQSYFEWCHRWPPTTSPSSKMGLPNAPQDQLRDVCCHPANTKEDIDKLFAGCHYQPSDVAFRQIT